MRFREKSISKLYAFAMAAVFALVLAGCGGGGGGTTAAPPDETPMPTPEEMCTSDGNVWSNGACITPAQFARQTCEAANGRYNADGSCTSAADIAQEMITAAQNAASTAAAAANAAYEAAKAAVMAQDDNMSADPGSYAIAMNARDRAMAAATAAQAASDAAAAATDVAAAEAQRDIALAKQGEAEAEQANAEMYAGMVQTAQGAIDDEEQRVLDVAAAKAAAMASYEAADVDATKAETAATSAETTAPGSPGAMVARDAATAARNSANAAQAAHDAITDDMTKEEADMKAADAATAASAANSSYMTAKAENDDIQTSASTLAEQQRVRDVADATTAAGNAATAARAAATAARASATSAREAADAARASYMAAMAARTDATNAQMQYMAADTAATAAETAATAAEAAADAAEAAHTSIDAAGSGADAKAAQATAEMKQSDAEGSAETASTQYMAANTAMGEAATAAGTHVLGLLMKANAVGVMDDTETMADEQAARVMAVATAIGDAAAAGNGSGNTSVAVNWPGDTPANPDASPPTELVEGTLSIELDPEGSGTALTFRTKAVEADPAAGVTAAPKTATMIDGLGDFMHGYSLSDGTRHAIVFTDKVKGKDLAAAVTAVTARSVRNQAITTASELAKVTSTGSTITGVEWTPSGEAPLTGTLSCPAETACSITLDADGAVSAIAGYTFTGSRAARAAAAAVTADNTNNSNYLAFGFWLQEDDNSDTTLGDPDFGAFAGGGSVVTADTYGGAVVTGTATYNGSATGLYTAGSSVDYFSADATLMANFGTPGTAADATAADDDLGSVTGMINNIVAGGMAMEDVIYLDALDGDTGTDGIQNITATGALNGRARMGTGITNQVTGAVTYPYNGAWSGQFYNGTADVATTTNVNESHVAPGSVVGTFGVTGTVGTGDDAVTRSFVGAFGAHKQ